MHFPPMGVAFPGATLTLYMPGSMFLDLFSRDLAAY